MRPEAEVRAELGAIGGDISDSIVQALAQELLPDEAVEAGLHGRGAGKIHVVGIDGTQYRPAMVLLAWTPLRVLSVQQGWKSGVFTSRPAPPVTQAVYWRDVASCVLGDEGRLVGGGQLLLLSVTGWGAAERVSALFEASLNERVLDCYEKIQQRVSQLKAEAPAAASDRGSGPGLVDQLERLAALRTSGHISDDEFELAKRRLLGA